MTAFQEQISGVAQTQSELASEQSAQALEQARQAIEQTSETSTASPAAAAPSSPQALSLLHSPWASYERAQAVQAAQGLLTALDQAAQQKQSVDAMMALLLKETHEARRRKIWASVKLTGLILMVIWLLWTTHGRYFGSYWWLFNIGGGAWAADKAVGKRREAATALSQSGEPRTVGVLAVARRDGDRAVQQIADSALRRLLPRVRASDASHISNDQMNALLELAFRSDEGMQISVLQALEQIGDQRAIPVVQNLIAYSPPRVQHQAELCLPFLTERAQRAEQSATLLRGTSGPSVGRAPQELLRASVGRPDSTPDSQLLRPTDSGVKG